MKFQIAYRTLDMVATEQPSMAEVEAETGSAALELFEQQHPEVTAFWLYAAVPQDFLRESEWDGDTRAKSPAMQHVVLTVTKSNRIEPQPPSETLVEAINTIHALAAKWLPHIKGYLIVNTRGDTYFYDAQGSLQKAHSGDWK